jgi:hypothetical protein
VRDSSLFDFEKSQFCEICKNNLTVAFLFDLLCFAHPIAGCHVPDIVVVRWRVGGCEDHCVDMVMTLC